LKRLFFGALFVLLLLAAWRLDSSFHQARAEPKTWTVDDDGPADFHMIQEAINAATPGDTVFAYNGTYHECLTVNKTLRLLGEGADRTTVVSEPINTNTVNITANNVTLSGFKITTGFDWTYPPPMGIIIVEVYGSYIELTKNILNSSYAGLGLSGSHNTVMNNSILYCLRGIYVASPNSCISCNIVDASTCMWVGDGSSTVIAGNHIGGINGLILEPGALDVTIVDNTIETSFCSVRLFNTYGARIYHNNFIRNDYMISENSAAVWDDGYPSGGNFWSNYTDADFYKGPYQNETGSDGIGDKKRVIDAHNVDNYPLMKPYPWGSHDIGIAFIGKVYYQFEFIPIVPLNTIVGIGLSVHFNVFVMNYGNNAESFNVTVYANSTIIGSQTNILLASRTSVILNFTWETIPGPAKSNYVLSAQATPVPDETDTTDNQATAEIYVTIAADVTGDGKVDLRDIFMIAKSYGRNVGDPGYNTNYDVNDDGKIDLKDYYFACARFGNISP
jgi:hypothetical protein